MKKFQFKPVDSIMRKLFFVLLLLASGMTADAQKNIQVHYDLGRNIYSAEEANRQKVTLTLEQYNADKLGCWFYFVDIDMSSHFIESAYTQIFREFNLAEHSPFAAHIEYNGGLNRNSSFQHAALAGFSYNGHSADFSKTWSVQLMYKQFFKSYEYTHSYASAELSVFWALNFAKRKFTFSGITELWRSEKANGHGCLALLAEPQLWYNLTNHFSVGTEWEFSNNFVYNTDPESTKTFFWNPTLAVKWNF